jgi:hypothetical protein
LTPRAKDADHTIVAEERFMVATARHCVRDFELMTLNVRSDPFESYDNKDSAGHMMQRMS